jgi:predicted enzyme related to lactoylglutathione lyase
MSDTPAPLGRISWVDLTVPDAPSLRDFYTKVAGWTAMPLSMGEYDDYVMLGSDGAPQAGVCHARGANSDIPPQWVMYVTVEGLDEKLRDVAALGGKVLMPVRRMGNTGRYAMIEDPAGAVCALFETASPESA